MQVNNVKIYDLDESLVAAGYPMRTTAEMREATEQDVKRGTRLSKAASGGNGAHNQFMTGIRVAFDLTCSNKMWVEAERYRFLEFVSSQSTMHRITKFAVRKQYNEYVDPRVIDIMEEKIARYNALDQARAQAVKDNKVALVVKLTEQMKQLYLEILYTNPAGFELTARMTTNYRCLKNIYVQRHDHRLPEWREFCKWIKTLPYAQELILCET